MNGPKPQNKLYVWLCVHLLCNELLKYDFFFVCLIFLLVEISFKSWLPLSDNVILNRGGSHSYSTQRDKNLARLTGYAANNRRFDDRNSETSTTLANEVDSRSLKLFLMVLILCFCYDTSNWKFHLSIFFYFLLYLFL